MSTPRPTACQELLSVRQQRDREASSLLLWFAGWLHILNSRACFGRELKPSRPDMTGRKALGESVKRLLILRRSLREQSPLRTAIIGRLIWVSMMRRLATVNQFPYGRHYQFSVWSVTEDERRRRVFRVSTAHPSWRRCGSRRTRSSFRANRSSSRAYAPAQREFANQVRFDGHFSVGTRQLLRSSRQGRVRTRTPGTTCRITGDHGAQQTHRRNAPPPASAPRRSSRCQS